MPNTSDAPGGSKAKPKSRTNAVGAPEPEAVQPVQPYDTGRPRGERQDGAGIAPPRTERTDAVPAGSTHARRAGADAGQAEEPDSAHRGQPASFRNGSTQGSGASAGGTRTGGTEDLDSDSKSGGSREGGHGTSRKDG